MIKATPFQAEAYRGFAACPHMHPCESATLASTCLTKICSRLGLPSQVAWVVTIHTFGSVGLAHSYTYFFLALLRVQGV